MPKNNLQKTRNNVITPGSGKTVNLQRGKFIFVGFEHYLFSFDFFGFLTSSYVFFLYLSKRSIFGYA